MNQNLLSLMKNAGFVFWEDEDWKPEDAVIDWATNYDKEIEKFAELIVRECLEIVNRKEYSYHEADPLWETAGLIKEHFGVEE